jgi:hypothetical protein
VSFINYVFFSPSIVTILGAVLIGDLHISRSEKAAIPGPPSGSQRVSNAAGSSSSVANTLDAESSKRTTAFQPRDRGRSFGAVLAQARSEGKSHGTTLDELETHRVRELPSVCQVTNFSLQDPLLRSFYEDLPNLR